MCGIAGVAIREGGSAPTMGELVAMCDSILHRGPDGDGFDICDGVALGMRRLAIIDVVEGSQPYFNEDRSVRAVFNGEIYNFPELRTALVRRGHAFRSATDGEVIVHLWEEYGADFVHQLNGMFAIALHDTRRRQLLLVRDRLGIKPLYYSVNARALVFGSEVKALLASGRVDRQLDLDALGEFLAWEYVPAPRTLFSAVRKLHPGEMLELDLATNSVRQRIYWDVPSPNGEAPARPAAEWEEAIDAQVRTSVRRQLISDVPLGALLSGGVDSSLVVAAMGSARTFSIGFEDPSYNEVRWARRVAEHLGTSHEVEIIRPDAMGLFERLMHFMDDPIGDFSIFPTYLVSQLARRSVTVALTGDGGDEVFGGYESFLAQDKARQWERIPAPLRKGVVEPLIRWLSPKPEKKGLTNKLKRFVEGMQHPPGLEHARWRLFVGEEMRAKLFTPDALARMQMPYARHVLELCAASGPRADVDRQLYVDLKSYLSDNCLVKVDRMSMACSLEARVPLLDHELVELAFAMPATLKVHGGQTKILLKKLASRYVPRDAVYRPKQGFSIPLKHWLRDEFRPLVDQHLAPERLAEDGIFDPATVSRLWQEHRDQRANHSHVLWGLLVFQDWRRRWAC